MQIPDYRNAVIVARNPGSAKKATSYAERLRLGIAVIHGEQKESDADEVSFFFVSWIYMFCCSRCSLFVIRSLSFNCTE